MPINFLVTGSPGIGKTTVIEKVISILEENGYEAGGIFCPDIRENGNRKGFKIVDILTGNSKILAHVDRSEGPRVGKYRVNVENVDDMSRSAISRALKECDIVAIDEIAPMEVYSEVFRNVVDECLESEKPLLAAIHKRSTTGFIGKVKDSSDSKIYEVRRDNRGELPRKISNLILKKLP